ncbi:MAG: transposase [Succinatimonas sp.]|nr:transposase [Succinatimonas sp.]
MSYFLPEGKILIARQPVSGRFGVPRLMANLSANAAKYDWNGVDPINVITFNKFRDRCKIISYDRYGVTLTVRVLHSGRFKVMLDEGLIPSTINKSELEELMRTGTLSTEKIKL